MKKNEICVPVIQYKMMTSVTNSADMDCRACIIVPNMCSCPCLFAQILVFTLVECEGKICSLLCHTESGVIKTADCCKKPQARDVFERPLGCLWKASWSDRKNLCRQGPRLSFWCCTNTETAMLSQSLYIKTKFCCVPSTSNMMCQRGLTLLKMSWVSS